MTVALEPMPTERLDAWIAQRHSDYVESRIKAGESREVAAANADRSHASNFPGGRPRASHRVFDVVVDGAVVGHVWIGPQLEGSDQWWVYDIEIGAAHRRRGYARQALELAHAAAKSLGAAAIGLNVFGYNTGARDLYVSLGYEETAIQMKLPL